MIKRLAIFLILWILSLLAPTLSYVVPRHHRQTVRNRLHSVVPTPRVMSHPAHPWYSHSDLKRDRTHLMDSPLQVLFSNSSRFVLLETSKGMYHRVLDPVSNEAETAPLFLSCLQLEHLMKTEEIEASFLGNHINLIAWVGNSEGLDYFVCYFQEPLAADSIAELMSDTTIRISKLREFGDRLTQRMDAAILATSNGLVEFHKSHPFCAKCGSPTKSVKCGACRQCTSCKASVYPRIDVAAIMLITSQCGEYALLGRKAAWPKGRYSTLAGFCEVGETLEQCCVREVQEESGIEVQLDSVRFTCSQPWPFPRSLMAGFRGQAKQDGDTLPDIRFDEKEMQDVQWFHRDFVRERLEGGSSALNFEPNLEEEKFHIPGNSSLARMLITLWVNEKCVGV
jgi:NADH pyrophosphatase NudC (nudix superfamily)